MSDDDTESIRVLMERIAMAFESTQKANAATLSNLHSLATTRSMMHLGLAILAMVLLSGLLYWGQYRAEMRAFERWADMSNTLRSIPAQTARAINVNQEVKIGPVGENPVENLARDVLLSQGKIDGLPRPSGSTPDSTSRNSVSISDP